MQLFRSRYRSKDLRNSSAFLRCCFYFHQRCPKVDLLPIECVCTGLSLVPLAGDISLILSFSKLCMFFLYPLTLTGFFTFLLYIVLSLFDINLGYH